jgi:hypothetical protein
VAAARISWLPPADSSTSDADAKGGAWSSVPPLSRTVGLIQATAQSVSFVRRLATRRPASVSLAPLRHDVSLRAPRGLVSGIARVVARSHSQRELEFVQRRVADGSPDELDALASDDAPMRAHETPSSDGESLPTPTPRVLRAAHAASERPRAPLTRLELPPGALPRKPDRASPPPETSANGGRDAVEASVAAPSPPEAPGAAAAAVPAGPLAADAGRRRLIRRVGLGAPIVSPESSVAAVKKPAPSRAGGRSAEGLKRQDRAAVSTEGLEPRVGEAVAASRLEAVAAPTRRADGREEGVGSKLAASSPQHLADAGVTTSLADLREETRASSPPTNTVVAPSPRVARNGHRREEPTPRGATSAPLARRGAPAGSKPPAERRREDAPPLGAGDGGRGERPAPRAAQLPLVTDGSTGEQRALQPESAVAGRADGVAPSVGGADGLAETSPGHVPPVGERHRPALAQRKRETARRPTDGAPRARPRASLAEPVVRERATETNTPPPDVAAPAPLRASLAEPVVRERATERRVSASTPEPDGAAGGAPRPAGDHSGREIRRTLAFEGHEGEATRPLLAASPAPSATPSKAADAASRRGSAPAPQDEGARRAASSSGTAVPLGKPSVSADAAQTARPVPGPQEGGGGKPTATAARGKAARRSAPENEGPATRGHEPVAPGAGEDLAPTRPIAASSAAPPLTAATPAVARRRADDRDLRQPRRPDPIPDRGHAPSRPRQDVHGRPSGRTCPRQSRRGQPRRCPSRRRAMRRRGWRDGRKHRLAAQPTLRATPGAWGPFNPSRRRSRPPFARSSRPRRPTARGRGRTFRLPARPPAGSPSRRSSTATRRRRTPPRSRGRPKKARAGPTLRFEAMSRPRAGRLRLRRRARRFRRPRRTARRPAERRLRPATRRRSIRRRSRRRGP